jgi:hypothetical protein
VVLDATAPEQTLRLLIRTSSVPGVGVNVTLAPNGSSDANIEIVLLHEGPTNQQDEFRTLRAAPGTNARPRPVRVGLSERSVRSSALGAGLARRPSRG